MRYFKFLTTITFSLCIVACGGQLDIEPQQSVSIAVATENAANVEAILISAYVSGRFNYNGDLANVAVLLGNTDQVGWNGTFTNLSDIYSKQMTNSNGSAATIYGNGYLLFADANTVLANLDKFEDQDRKDRIEGEALFLRGLGYFDMARLFGQQYNAGGGNTQPAVPIVLDPPDGDRKIPRNTVEEVYTQAISDLTAAYNKLPASNGTQADKYAAQAILARVYLQQGNYVAARDAAHDVIENSGHSLESSFSNVFGSDDNTDETIFSWVVTTQESSNAQVTHFASEELGGRGGDIFISQDYIDKFDSDLDKRKEFNYTDGGSTLSSKFTKQFANAEQVRLAEMYLIRAECNFREGESTGAAPLIDINTIRARSSAPALATLTLDLILTERELELGFEGFALHDYKRTQRNIGSLAFNHNKLIFPIPRSARDRNSLLSQNDGY